MNARLTYTREFAESLYIPFIKGCPIWTLIVRADSTIDEFMADGANWFSATEKRFSRESMVSIWGVIEFQKNLVQAAFNKASDA